jgi:homoserine dehydrogenase
MSLPMLRIGLFGFGTVGQGVWKILQSQSQSLQNRTSREIQIEAIYVRDVGRYKIQYPELPFVNSPDAILNNPDIGVVVEVMGGENPAKELVIQSLRKGKRVVTANKELLGKHKSELFHEASLHHSDIYFEAAVGGGIPIIRSFKVGFSANSIQSFFGILNGTTNYILTKMSETEGQSLASVLSEAQSLGFAEADPTMDISGADVAYKLTILAAVAFKIDVGISDIHFEGIESIDSDDIAYARQFGYEIKLLAMGKQLDANSFVLKVHPTMVPIHHPLASVRDEFNAVFLTGDSVGEAMLYGKGAGSLPTASAVISDLIDIAFEGQGPGSARNLETNYRKVAVEKIEDQETRFYLRLNIQDIFGVLEKIAAVFGTNHISLANLIQKERDESTAQLVIVTHKVPEKNMQNAIVQLKQLVEVLSVQSVIRVGLD